MNRISSLRHTMVVGQALFALLLGSGAFATSMVLGEGVPKSAILPTLLGLILTSVAFPMVGLFALFLYEGDYLYFFDKMGRRLGFLFITLLMIFLGPFGALAKAIALSFAAWHELFKEANLSLFALFYCFVIYFCAAKKSIQIPLLGKLVVPLLLLFLLALFTIGFSSQTTGLTSSTPFQGNYFHLGMSSGHQVLAFIAVLFFSHAIVNSLKQVSIVEGKIDRKKMLKASLKSAYWSSFLLIATYAGLVLLSNKYGGYLEGHVPDRLFEIVSCKILGRNFGVAGCVIPVLIYLSASVVFSSIFAEFIHTAVTKQSLSYSSSLILTLFCSYGVVVFQWYELFYFVSVLVHLLYPALLTLTILNILQKKGWIKLSTLSFLGLMFASILIVRLTR